MEEEAQALPLPRNLLFALPVGEGLLGAASALALDEAHVAVVGVPHPSAGAGKGKCCLITLPQQTTASIVHLPSPIIISFISAGVIMQIVASVRVWHFLLSCHNLYSHGTQ